MQTRLSLFVLSLLVVGAVPSVGTASAAAAAACTPQSSPFNFASAIWGTAGSPLSVYPGSQNVPLTVTMLFSGPCSSPQATFTLSLTSGSAPLPFSQSSGNSPTTVGLNISPNTLVAETFYLSVLSSATTGVTYSFPLTIQYASNDASNIVTQTLAVPVVLQGPVTIDYEPNFTSLVAGAVNDVIISITNTGMATSGAVSTTVTAPASVTLLNQLATTSGLAPGATSSQTLQLFVPSSVSGTAFALTFTGKYLDAYFNSQTVTKTLGFLASTPTVAAASSFVVEGATWGSAASTTSPLPGTQDTPLVVSLQYLGSTPVTSLQGTVQLPAGVTDLNGRSTAAAYSSATTNQYGALQLTFYLNIASTVRPGSYNLTLSLNWMTSQSLGLTQTVVLSPPPIAQLQSQFQVQGSTWGNTPTATAPVPGTLNSPLVVSLQYIGTTSVTSLKGTLTLPGGITDLNGHQTATAYAAAVSPNQVITLTFYLDVASTAKPGSYNYTLDLSWTTAVSVTMGQSSSLSPPPVATPTTTASFPLSVTQQNSTVVAGSQTSAAFQLTNQGTAPIYSPTFSLAVASPLVLASIGTPVPAAEIDAGKSTTFVAHVTSGPSATAGIYGGTLTLAFTDSNGASHTQAFPVGFTLQGTIILILQNTAVTQTANGFTITGSILNEGSVAAYYASITGLLGVNTATAVYLGEIDPNTPLPFSVTIPFVAPTSINSTTTASGAPGAASTTSTSTSSASTTSIVIGTRTITGPPGGFRNGSGGGFPGGIFNRTQGAGAPGSANIALSLTFKDSFSKNQVQAFTVPATIKTASQLSGGSVLTKTGLSPGSARLTDIAYGVFAAILATVVVGAFMLRRYRARRFASFPAQDKGEQSVI